MSGEKSDTAKGDRLRIKEFQDFWYKVQENLLMLRQTTSDGVSTKKTIVAQTNQEVCWRQFMMLVVGLLSNFFMSKIDLNVDFERYSPV